MQEKHSLACIFTHQQTVLFQESRINLLLPLIHLILLFLLRKHTFRIPDLYQALCKFPGMNTYNTNKEFKVQRKPEVSFPPALKV